MFTGETPGSNWFKITLVDNNSEVINQWDFAVAKEFNSNFNESDMFYSLSEIKNVSGWGSFEKEIMREIKTYLTQKGLNFDAC
jgi:hypothetical protein